MKTTPKILLAAGLATTLIVSGCAGNDDRQPITGSASSVPDSAGASPAAFMAFLLTLKPDDETSEPLTLNDSFAVPDDEVDDPQPLA